jgi:hypothetical protein
MACSVQRDLKYTSTVTIPIVAVFLRDTKASSIFDCFEESTR